MHSRQGCMCTKKSTSDEGKPSAIQLVAVAATALLASCASSPQPGQVSPVSAMPATSFETRHRNQALAFMQQGRWADATVQWEILDLLEPDNPEYKRNLIESQTQSKRIASECLRAAAESRRHGDLEAATVSYLKALNAEPNNQQAMQGLRQIDAEKVARSYLNRTGRIIARPYPVQTTVRDHGAAPLNGAAPFTQARQDLDLGIMLVRQGDYASAIQALEKYLRQDPQDESARRNLGDAYSQLADQRLNAGRKEEALAYLEKAQSLKDPGSNDLADAIRSLRLALAEQYYQMGARAYYTDLDKAIALWERSLQFNPEQKQAALRLQQAREAARKLKAIGAGSRQR